METRRYRAATLHKEQQMPQYPEEEEREILKIAKILVDLNARKKRRRHQTTPEQLRLLESIFAVNRTPDLTLRTKLSGQLDMTPRRIQIWFQNKRAKMKKLRKMQEEPGATPTSSPMPSPTRAGVNEVSPPSSPASSGAHLDGGDALQAASHPSAQLVSQRVIPNAGAAVFESVLGELCASVRT
eukprot:CAMPEP_0114619624 /NCGR_PEP_ID=MMETSP0168-20121206/8307_1 /TAXON_ID=95228 ORGANISM="Vannella sp., Strain DIVA3 517/6/12" /NCGR_SAMPLE_ID=MMETSP0168 /ASSEMBLY_ACC=CAM_ASM_000044 /LENGTH=183 /DNA_ID=CAMNT_0001830793 /DNA_START=46 /DNA_END=596 /DNA_ORIENTATION=+